MNRLYKHLYIDGFKLTKQSQIITFNSTSNTHNYDNHENIIGMNNTLIYSSPNSLYTSQSYFTMNDLYYDMNKISYNSIAWNYNITGNQEIKIESETFMFKYAPFVRGVCENILVESIQYKPDKHTSICISYEHLTNFNSNTDLSIHKDRLVFGLELYDSSNNRRVWYNSNNIQSIQNNIFSGDNVDNIYNGIMYFMEIVPFSEMDEGCYCENKRIGKLKIKNCTLLCKNSSDLPSDCYTFCNDGDEKYLVGII